MYVFNDLDIYVCIWTTRMLKTVRMNVYKCSKIECSLTLFGPLYKYDKFYSFKTINVCNQNIALK